jgi:hypothetical protein
LCGRPWIHNSTSVLTCSNESYQTNQWFPVHHMGMQGMITACWAKPLIFRLLHNMNQSAFCLSLAKNTSDNNVGQKTTTMTFHFCLTKAVCRWSVLLFSISALNLYYATNFSLDDSTYYGTIFLFCSWVRMRKHVEWYWCSLCSQSFNPVFKKDKELLLGIRMIQMKTTIHRQKSHDRLMVQWAK